MCSLNMYLLDVAAVRVCCGMLLRLIGMLSPLIVELLFMAHPNFTTA